MFCRAKICVLLVIAGAITASAASLDMRQKSTTFSTENQATPTIVKPSETKARLGTASRWRRVKVQKINPTSQSSTKVEVSGFIFRKAADVPSPSIAGIPAASGKQ